LIRRCGDMNPFTRIRAAFGRSRRVRPVTDSTEPASAAYEAPEPGTPAWDRAIHAFEVRDAARNAATMREVDAEEARWNQAVREAEQSLTVERAREHVQRFERIRVQVAECGHDDILECVSCVDLLDEYDGDEPEQLNQAARRVMVREDPAAVAAAEAVYADALARQRIEWERKVRDTAQAMTRDEARDTIERHGYSSGLWHVLPSARELEAARRVLTSDEPTADVHAPIEVDGDYVELDCRSKREIWAEMDEEHYIRVQSLEGYEQYFSPSEDAPEEYWRRVDEEMSRHYSPESLERPDEEAADAYLSAMNMIKKEMIREARKRGHEEDMRRYEEEVTSAAQHMDVDEARGIVDGTEERERHHTCWEDCFSCAPCRAEELLTDTERHAVVVRYAAARQVVSAVDQADTTEDTEGVAGPGRGHGACDFDPGLVGPAGAPEVVDDGYAEAEARRREWDRDVEDFARTVSPAQARVILAEARALREHVRGCQQDVARCETCSAEQRVGFAEADRSAVEREAARRTLARESRTEPDRGTSGADAGVGEGPTADVHVPVEVADSGTAAKAAYLAGMLQRYTLHYECGDHQLSPWPEDPDGGELRIVLALHRVLPYLSGEALERVETALEPATVKPAELIDEDEGADEGGFVEEETHLSPERCAEREDDRGLSVLEQRQIDGFYERLEEPDEDTDDSHEDTESGPRAGVDDRGSALGFGFVAPSRVAGGVGCAEGPMWAARNAMGHLHEQRAVEQHRTTERAGQVSLWMNDTQADDVDRHGSVGWDVTD
jgi:hypothetical protein